MAVESRESLAGTIGADALLALIRSRRNVKEFSDEPVARELVEQIIEAATWAPNHRHTEPWRFIVLEKGGATRAKVAEMVHDWTYENVKNPTEARRKQSAEAIREEVLSFPAMLYVFSAPGDNEEITRENFAASCCAAQNMLLAAHALGLSVAWSTGRTCQTDGVFDVIGADPEWAIVGSFAIGYGGRAPRRTRMAIDEVTSWI